MTSAPQPELYIDGLLDISFARGVVRVDLYSLSATEKLSTGQPKPEHRQRLLMSAQSFVEFASSLQGAAQSLRDQGVVGAGAQQPQKSAEPDAPPTEPDAQSVSAAPQVSAEAAEELEKKAKRAPTSPNFTPRRADT